MTQPDPERAHTQEPAEGAEHPGGEQATPHTPHPEQPAEGNAAEGNAAESNAPQPPDTSGQG